MIVKRGQPVDDLQLYVRRSPFIRAKKMREDFMVESGLGWQQGKKGDWLVELHGDFLTPMEDKQFKGIFSRYDPDRHCAGPCLDHGPTAAEHGLG